MSRDTFCLGLPCVVRECQVRRLPSLGYLCLGKTWLNSEDSTDNKEGIFFLPLSAEFKTFLPKARVSLHKKQGSPRIYMGPFLFPEHLPKKSTYSHMTERK